MERERERERGCVAANNPQTRVSRSPFPRSHSPWLSLALSADLDYTMGGGHAKSREQKAPAFDASFDTTGLGLGCRPQALGFRAPGFRHGLGLMLGLF